MTKGPLDGIRVLDFSRVLAGPHCGRLLADMGADVVKVEPPEGDLTRFAHPKVNSLALYFIQQNCGKRNLSVDLSMPEATELLLRLCEHADVVLENFRPGVMDRLGLGYDTVSSRNPRIVYASISGYGQGGPWSDRRAYAAAIHAEMGLTDGLNRHFRMDRMRNDPASHADVYAGLHGLAGILAALYQRESSGIGQHVDVAMAEALLTSNEHLQWELSDIDVGDDTPSMAPGNSPVFLTAEGHHVTVVGDPCGRGVFEQYCRAMHTSGLGDDPRFADVSARRRHREELLDVVQAWVVGFDDLEALEAALGEGELAMGVVRSVVEAAEGEWAAARGAVVAVDDRGGGTVRIPNSPWRFSGAATGVGGVPAYRGEHNREVLAELLGLDPGELDRLEEAGVLSSRLPERVRRP